MYAGRPHPMSGTEDFIGAYRVGIVGDTKVGKTTMKNSFLLNGVTDQDSTSLPQEKLCVVGDGVGIVQVLDMSAQRSHRALRKGDVKSAEGFLILYSVTDGNSFCETRKYHDYICRYKGNDHVPMMLIGNKTDLEHERVVSTAEGLRFSHELGIPFMECSAKMGLGVEEIFQTLLKDFKPRSENGEVRVRKKCTIL